MIVVVIPALKTRVSMVLASRIRVWGGLALKPRVATVLSWKVPVSETLSRQQAHASRTPASKAVLSETHASKPRVSKTCAWKIHASKPRVSNTHASPDAPASSTPHPPQSPSPSSFSSPLQVYPEVHSPSYSSSQTPSAKTKHPF